MKAHLYSRKAQQYCYERWNKAKSREAELFWINAYGKYFDMLAVASKEEMKRK